MNGLRSLLLRRFDQTARAFGAPIDEPFYDTTRSDPADHLSRPDRITSTIEFAAQISDGAPWPVDSSPSLAFRYVDRELSPLRSTGSHRFARRSLDLLLANANDDLPIYGELKIGGDKPAYFALVQLLALAADLLPESQRVRLKGTPADPTCDGPKRAHMRTSTSSRLTPRPQARTEHDPSTRQGRSAKSSSRTSDSPVRSGDSPISKPQPKTTRSRSAADSPTATASKPLTPRDPRWSRPF